MVSLCPEWVDQMQMCIGGRIQNLLEVVICYGMCSDSDGMCSEETDIDKGQAEPDRRGLEGT
jgi:hypothetical protein